MRIQQIFGKKQGGASLIIGLVLLMVLSVLAISTMSSASMQLTMAGNTQFAGNAFQMAETAVDRSIASGPFSTSALTLVAPTAVADPNTGSQIGIFQAATQFQQDTAPPSGGYSIGTGSGFRAYHFQIAAIGQSSRNAQENHTQEFYVIGPGGP
jgi:hypothetical protein